MAIPTKKKFLYKFVTAIIENENTQRSYFERFGITHNKQAPEKTWEQIIGKLSYYGGYTLRRSLVECVPINEDDCVLDIGPEMGMECFLLAEVYKRVIVAEPDATSASLLKSIAKYYYTEDGRKASDILDVRQIGIFPPGATHLNTAGDGKPTGLPSFDVRGAADISDTLDLHFADRVICNHIVWAMPKEVNLSVLLSALSSYCSQRGIITWAHEPSELSAAVVDYAEYKGYALRGGKTLDQTLDCVLLCPRSEIETYITELLPDFTVTFRFIPAETPASLKSSGKLYEILTIARRS